MDVYDFYKPHHSEFAEVDGGVSTADKPLPLVPLAV